MSTSKDLNLSSTDVELDRVSEWLKFLPDQGVDQVLNDLELDRTGDIWEKKSRLYKCLKGDYSANDFVPSRVITDDQTLLEHRSKLRIKCITSLGFFKSDAEPRHFEYDEDLMSFDEIYAHSSNIEINASSAESPASKVTSTFTSTTGPKSANAQGNGSTATRTTQIITTPVSTPSMINTSDSVPVVLGDGVPYVLPKRVAEMLFCAQKIIEDQNVSALRSMQHNETYAIPPRMGHSTILSSARAPNVQNQNFVSNVRNQISEPNFHNQNFSSKNKSRVYFAETQQSEDSDLNFDYLTSRNTQFNTNVNNNQFFEENYMQRPNAQSTQAFFNQKTNSNIEHRELRENNEKNYLPKSVWENTREEAPLSSRTNKHEVPSALIKKTESAYFPHNTHVNSSQNVKKSDIGTIVRRWNLKFSGKKGESIEEFLTRVQECKKLAHLTDTEVLDALSELFTGVALQWIRQSRHEWENWQDFSSAARSCYGTNKLFKIKLRAEAEARTQGKDEPVRDYIICLRAILSKLPNEYTSEQALELLYNNMHPELKKLVRRSEVKSWNELLDCAREAEITLAAERTYKPPPPPEQSLMPEVAFKCSQASLQPKIAAIDNQVDIAAILNKYIQESMKNAAEKSSNNQPKNQNNRPNNNKKNNFSPNQKNNNSDKKNVEQSSSKKSEDKKTDDAMSDKSESSPQKKKKSFKKYCWDCKRPGYTRYTCPECPGKAKEDA